VSPSRPAPIRALIVDDERLARARLRALLGEVARDVEVVGECAAGDDAVAAVGALSPQLVLLDVQMPGLDGFDVVRAVGARRMPAVVFVTAFDQYALKAFDVHAVDYLLKPVLAERLAEALERVRARLGGAGAPSAPPDDGPARRLEALLEQLAHRDAYLERVVVRVQERFLVIRTADVDWLEGADNYVRIHAARRAYLLRGTLAGMEERLDPRRFLRIHRSTIINLDRVREFQLWFQGEYVVTLTDGTRLNVSRGYRNKLLELVDPGPRGA
jgi:two-component system LytT family response regulator